MATQTTNLGLTLPGYEDAADIAALNENFRRIDEATAQRSAAVEVTLPSDGWEESPTKGQWTKMWTQTVTDGAIEAGALLSIDPGSDGNLLHLIDNSISLVATNNDDGSATVKAFGAKPGIDLSIQLILQKGVRA